MNNQSLRPTGRDSPGVLRAPQPRLLANQSSLQEKARSHVCHLHVTCWHASSYMPASVALVAWCWGGAHLTRMGETRP